MITEANIIQNLKDAGFSESQIEEFMGCAGKHEMDSGLKLLRQQRNVLLDELHEKQRMIECLDYLAYQLRKEEIKL